MPTPGIVAVVPTLYDVVPILNSVTDKILFSESKSSVPSVNTLPVACVFSLTDFISSTAIGASFTGVTVKFKVPTSEPPLVSVAV